MAQNLTFIKQEGGSSHLLVLILNLHSACPLRVWERGGQRLCWGPHISVTVSMTQLSKTSTYVGCPYALMCELFSIKNTAGEELWACVLHVICSDCYAWFADKLGESALTPLLEKS